MAQINSNAFDNLRGEVIADGGVRAVRMETLRNAAGYGKLGKWVVREISDELRRRGLGHSPDPLPADSWAMVLVYELGSQVERVVNAVLAPSAEGADVVREFANQDAGQILDKIRALVEPATVEAS